MIKINIKPLSVNEAWKGRRFKTDKYKDYAKYIMYTLTKKRIPKTKLSVAFEFGFSNKDADIDNPLKPIIDILQSKHEFNDSQIYRLVVEKRIVKKGEEYIKYKIDKYVEK